MDNTYRFAQAGYELSTMIGTLPSEGGYQPTLNSEVGLFHESLLSTNDGDITVVEAIFVPSDDITDNGVRAVFPFLDTTMVFSREVYQQGRYPSLDLLECSSSALNPVTIGSAHYNAYLKAKSILEQASSIERIALLVGESELSFQDQIVYKRSKIIKNYMTQMLFVVESQTGSPGVSVPIEKTVSDVERIVSGEFDQVDPTSFLYLGSLDESNIVKRVEEAKNLPSTPMPNSVTRSTTQSQKP